MRSSNILGILGIVFGFLGSFLVLIFSAIETTMITNAMVGIFASLLGILGIWVMDKDNKIAAAQYLVVGIGVLIGIGGFGILGFIFFIIAALVAFRDSPKTEEIKEVPQ